MLKYNTTRKGKSTLMANNSLLKIILLFIGITLLWDFYQTGRINLLFFNPDTLLITKIAYMIGLIAAITIHEFFHAFAAYRLGDPTAKLEGRLTLNPLAHLDPIGTVALLFVGFGWGKPTPFDPFNLRNVKRDSAIISAAGALSNFALAFIISLPYLITFIFQIHSPELNSIYQILLSPIIFVNILLGVFNLLPIAPLDGFKVLAGVLPKDWYYEFMQTEQFGIFILLFLIFSGMIGRTLGPIIPKLVEVLLPSLPLHF